MREDYGVETGTEEGKASDRTIKAVTWSHGGRALDCVGAFTGRAVN